MGRYSHLHGLEMVLGGRGGKSQGSAFPRAFRRIVSPSTPAPTGDALPAQELGLGEAGGWQGRERGKLAWLTRALKETRSEAQFRAKQPAGLQRAQRRPSRWPQGLGREGRTGAARTPGWHEGQALRLALSRAADALPTLSLSGAGLRSRSSRRPLSSRGGHRLRLSLLCRAGACSRSRTRTGAHSRARTCPSGRHCYPFGGSRETSLCSVSCRRALQS